MEKIAKIQKFIKYKLNIYKKRDYGGREKYIGRTPQIYNFIYGINNVMTRNFQVVSKNYQLFSKNYHDKKLLHA